MEALVILHAFLVLLAGFLTISVLLLVFRGLTGKLTPSWGPLEIQQSGHRPSAGSAYIFVNLASSFLSAAAGGYVTAWLSADNPLARVLALAISVLLLAALGEVQQSRERPIWYTVTLVALTPIGVLLGGVIRLRVLGIL